MTPTSGEPRGRGEDDEFIEPTAATLELAEALVARIRRSPLRDGSVDIHWKLAGFELLLNVGADGRVGLYADDYGTQKIKCEWTGAIR